METLRESLLASMDNQQLLSAARELAKRSRDVEVDLLIHLGEIDARQLYLDLAYPSMFAFLRGEYGYSEAAAYNRSTVARLGRRLPAALDALRAGRVHLTALRLLSPHLTAANLEAMLVRATGRSTDELRELVAALAPRPAAATFIRKVPSSASLVLETAADGSAREDSPEASLPELELGAAGPPPPHSSVPLAEDRYRLHVTTDRAFHDRLREAKDLCRHEIPDGDIAKLLSLALEKLIAEKKKAKYAVVRKPRETEPAEAPSRHVPAAVKRAVYERDGGRCAFTSDDGRRCEATAFLELDHIDGWAKTHAHDPARMRLLCRAHNQHTADALYGRDFMERARFKTSSDSPDMS